MKTWIKTIVLGLALVGALEAMALTGSARVIVNEGMTFDLVIANATQDFTISLKSDEGTTFYSKDVAGKSHFSTRFDVHFLDNGNYVLQLEDADRIQEFPIVIEGKSVNVSAARSFDLLKPTVTTKGEFIYVNALSVDRVARLRVNVYDNDDSSLMTDTIVGTNNIGRIYSMENLPSGSYKVVVSTDGKVFEHTIEK
ncbi:MAG: hypothetical protein KTR13_04395 [Saprospiraceae bacterium]|nr:hypothetical protein [Saprospiraceae bacterium]